MTAESDRAAKFLAWRKRQQQKKKADSDDEVVPVDELLRVKERGRFGDSE